MEAVESTSEMSLMDRYNKLVAEMKNLGRAIRHELKAKRRRRGLKKDGSKKDKGETPSQLKPWHDEVRRVWEELKSTDAKTPYKRAVAEAHLRRNGKAAPVEEKKGGKKTQKVEEVKVAAAPAPAKSEKKGKKSSA
jgi:hypothetical protein